MIRVDREFFHIHNFFFWPNVVRWILEIFNFLPGQGPLLHMNRSVFCNGNRSIDIQNIRRVKILTIFIHSIKNYNVVFIKSGYLFLNRFGLVYWWFYQCQWANVHKLCPSPSWHISELIQSGIHTVFALNWKEKNSISIQLHLQTHWWLIVDQ